MPYYPGATLQQIAERSPESVTPAWLEFTLGMLLGALELLHQRGYHHRDIAPDNIILDAEGLPVLLDFGATRRNLGSDVDEAMLIKPGYSPLEQYFERECNYGAWSDLYALGAVLYRLIGRRTPPASVVRSIQDTLLPLSDMGLIGYSPRTLAAIDRALGLHGDDRPQSVAEFAAELGMRRHGDRYLPGSPYYASSGATLRMQQEVEPKPIRHGGAVPWYLSRSGRLLTILITSLLSSITLLCWLALEREPPPTDTATLEPPQAGRLLEP
ncbi:Serine/threonine-protein kinase C [compost metagenome]